MEKCLGPGPSRVPEGPFFVSAKAILVSVEFSGRNHLTPNINPMAFCVFPTLLYRQMSFVYNFICVCCVVFLICLRRPGDVRETSGKRPGFAGRRSGERNA